MVKVLVVDDNPSRQAKFFIHKGDKDLRRTWNAAECIEALKEGDWDICSLDHDLESIPFDDPEKENSGSGIVRWVVEHKPDVKKFIVHSYNSKEAQKMVEALKAAGYSASWEPFNL